MILAQRWGQNPQHILQDLKVLHRCLRTAPVCHDNTAGCVSHGPGLCFVAGVLLFRVGSLQIAEQQVSITSGIHHFWNTNCILYIVKLKGIRLPFIRIAVVQANQASFYWREQDLMRFVTPPILKSSLNFFFFGFTVSFCLWFTIYLTFTLWKQEKAKHRTTNWMNWDSKLSWFVPILRELFSFGRC